MAENIPAPAQHRPHRFVHPRAKEGFWRGDFPIRTSVFLDFTDTGMNRKRRVPSEFRRGGPIMEAIYKLLREVKVLPPSPQVLPKVLDALHHEQTTLEEVGDLIALDPALTAKLLHYCNSVYFAGREPVASVP